GHDQQCPGDRLRDVRGRVGVAGVLGWGDVLHASRAKWRVRCRFHRRAVYHPPGFTSVAPFGRRLDRREELWICNGPYGPFLTKSDVTGAEPGIVCRRVLPHDLVFVGHLVIKRAWRLLLEFGL